MQVYKDTFFRNLPRASGTHYGLPSIFDRLIFAPLNIRDTKAEKYLLQVLKNRGYINNALTNEEKEKIIEQALETDEGRAKLLQSLGDEIVRNRFNIKSVKEIGSHKCNCSMQQLMREGCKCGGV